MALIQSLINPDKYNIKCPYTMKPKGICVHNTANDAPAKNEISYMKNNNQEVSYHIAIDDIESIQAIPFNRNAWAAGDGANGDGNRNYIHVEICYSLNGGERFVNAEKRAAKEIALLLKQNNWTIANVKKHQDFSGKYCPHRTLNQGWQRFLNMIQTEFNLLNNDKNQPNKPSNLYRVRKTWEDSKSQIGAYSELSNAKKECDKKSGYSVFDSKGIKVYPIIETPKPIPPTTPKPQGEYITSEYWEKGTFTCTVDSIYFRSKPIISNDNPIQGSYYKNKKVNYDYVVITNKYVYISWISASSGIRRYMPITDKANNEKWGYCV